MYWQKKIMPPLSLMTDSLSFQEQKIILRDEVIGTDGKKTMDEVAIEYGILL